MSEVRPEFKELERAMPIPLGAAKLLFAIFIMIGALIASALAIITAATSASLFIKVFCGAFSGACWLGVLVFTLWTVISANPYDPTWPGSWLKRYWRNNIVGQDCCVHLTDEGKYCIHVVKRRQDFSSGHCNEFTDRNRFFLRLNLGGWRNRSPNLFLEHHQQVTDLEYWKIKLKRFCYYHEDITLTVRDANGNTLTLEGRHLLNALAHLHNKRRDLAGDVIILLRHLLEYSERKHGQWQTEKAMADALATKLDSAIDIIFDESRVLKDTSRVGQSSEGKAIRERMEAGLLKILLPDDPRRKVIAPQPETA